MGIYARDRSSTRSNVKVWDPYTVFEIINPDRGYFTCVGYAPSKNRRCQCPINQYNRQHVYDLLDSISSLSPGSKEVKMLLQEIALKSLCVRFHRGQVEDVVEEWAARLSTIVRSSGRKRNDKTNDDRSKSFQPRSDRPGYYRRSSFNYGTQTEYESGERSRQRRRWGEDAREEKWQDDDDDDDDDVRERIRDNARQQREEQRRREANEREQERKERERKEKEQRKQEEAREKERKAREREAKERKAKEQAMKERREWQQAWHSYVTNWAAFKALEEDQKPSTVKQAQQQIPWPTKSGQFRDLKKSNVEEFYRKACPDVDTPDKMYRTMRAESLKWHPDKVKVLYHDCEPGVADMEVMKMICLTVLGLKEQADAAKAR